MRALHSFAYHYSLSLKKNCGSESVSKTCMEVREGSSVMGRRGRGDRTGWGGRASEVLPPHER